MTQEGVHGDTCAAVASGWPRFCREPQASSAAPRLAPATIVPYSRTVFRDAHSLVSLGGKAVRDPLLPGRKGVFHFCFPCIFKALATDGPWTIVHMLAAAHAGKEEAGLGRCVVPGEDGQPGVNANVPSSTSLVISHLKGSSFHQITGNNRKKE